MWVMGGGMGEAGGWWLWQESTCRRTAPAGAPGPRGQDCPPAQLVGQCLLGETI